VDVSRRRFRSPTSSTSAAPSRHCFPAHRSRGMMVSRQGAEAAGTSSRSSRFAPAPTSSSSASRKTASGRDVRRLLDSRNTSHRQDHLPADRRRTVRLALEGGRADMRSACWRPTSIRADDPNLNFARPFAGLLCPSDQRRQLHQADNPLARTPGAARSRTVDRPRGANRCVQRRSRAGTVGQPQKPDYHRPPHFKRDVAKAQP